MRGGVDAIGAGAEIDAIQVELEDLVLGVFVLEPERQQRLLNLPGEGALVGEEEVLRELLGDGAAALDDVAGAEIGEGGARQPPGIDAEMAVEAPVLGGDHRRRQIARHVTEAQRLAEEVAIGGHERAVRGQERHRGTPVGQRQRVDWRQRQREIGDNPAADDYRPQEAKQRPAPDAPARRSPPRRLAPARAPRAAPGRPVAGIGAHVAAASVGCHCQEIFSPHARLYHSPPAREEPSRALPQKCQSCASACALGVPVGRGGGRRTQAAGRSISSITVEVSTRPEAPGSGSARLR